MQSLEERLTGTLELAASRGCTVLEYSQMETYR